MQQKGGKPKLNRQNETHDQMNIKHMEFAASFQNFHKSRKALLSFFFGARTGRSSAKLLVHLKEERKEKERK